MASDVAHPEAINTSLPTDVPMTNGDHDQSMTDQENAGAFDENAALSSKTDFNQNPSGPTPIEDVAPGITPVSDFIPKDAPTSHPTPPPDELLVTSEANVDTEMSTTVDEDQVMDPPAPEAVASEAVSSESSLVRPRGDDDEDEAPAAKRNKVETDSSLDASAVEAPEVAAADATVSSEVAEEPALEAESEPVPEKIPEPVPSVTAPSPETTAPPASDVPMESQPSDVPVTITEAEMGSTEKPAEPVVDTDVKPSTELSKPEAPVAQQTTAPHSAQLPAQPANPPTDGFPRASYSTVPMTPAQLRYLQEKMKNLKKTKNSGAFLAPVDPVALNIPQYPDIIKSPMDLGTMDQKLKGGQYHSVQEFADDFYLIVNNARVFNGPNHPVTQSGSNMEAYFRKMMESVPSADQPVSKTHAKKAASPKPQNLTRREPRQAAQATAPAPVPLQPDGTPHIRRDSTINRPARAIKPPPARELPYSKPKRKEHQLELKFCDHVINELRGQKYADTNQFFLIPVDPVALNIPTYHNVVKHPMDLSSMAQKLKAGEYSKASEFKRDFDLIISNCLLFNPQGNLVRDAGIAFQRHFDALWRTKDKWESKRKAESQAASPASEEDSGDEEEDEEDAPSDEKSETIAALQKQLAEIQSALAGINKQPAGKKKKAKTVAKATTKKIAAAPKQKPAAKPKAAKKPKQVSYEEKQEISEAVGRMDGDQVEVLTKIITSNCTKYANQDEMELEIDDLPNNVQVLLLKYVRSIFGNPNKGVRAASPDDIAAFDDDDFEPERGGRKGSGAGKRKKHKPMGKKEQQDTINNIQKQLAQFQSGGATSGSQSPSSYALQEETSGDDESEESEEE